MHSTNTGLTWSATCRLAGSEYTYSPVPSIAATGSAVHLAWSKSHQVYHKCSYDRGFTWGPDMRLVSDSASSDGACVAASASDVHVVWERVTGLMDEIEVWHARSTDLGATWSAPVQLSQAEDWSMAPCVGVSGSSVHVVWQDNRGPLPGLFYARSTDRGATWNTPAAITQHPTVTLPSIAVSGSVVHLIWPDVPTPRDVNTEVYYRRSVNGGQTWGPETRLTSDTAWSEQPSVAVAGSRVHVVWEDERDGNDEIYYKRNPTGNAPGIEEQAATPADRQRSPATVVRGTLRLPAVDAGDEESPVLLDAAGRRVIDLYPGPNDLSRLAPGVYFCRLRAGDGNRTVKLVVQR
jgi:hypothetical protein